MKTQIKFYILSLILILCFLWLAVFIWVHQPVHLWVSVALILFWFLLTLFTLFAQKKQLAFAKYLKFSFLLLFLASLSYYFLLEPRNDRKWQDETAKIIQFEFKDGHVEIENVRNFIWRTPTDYDIQWEKRRYQIEKINSVDLIVSYFMKGPIAHVFVTFGFENGEHLAFSLEVRQEEHETFSTIGGFVRQYELALVVGDENDVIYSRSNVRGEDVYLYPIKMQQNEMQLLFLEYLNKANRLNHHPVWYNTLMSNCTTIMFDLIEHATGEIPRDYRILLPGLLPLYLNDNQLIKTEKNFTDWQKQAYLNPKVEHIQNIADIESQYFSQKIRALVQ